MLTSRVPLSTSGTSEEETQFLTEFLTAQAVEEKVNGVVGCSYDIRDFVSTINCMTHISVQVAP